MGVSLSSLATLATGLGRSNRIRCSIAAWAESIRSAKNRCLFKASSSRGVVGGVEQFSLLLQFTSNGRVERKWGEREKKGKYVHEKAVDIESY
jgi:hypothetical protein